MGNTYPDLERILREGIPVGLLYGAGDWYDKCTDHIWTAQQREIDMSEIAEQVADVE